MDETIEAETTVVAEPRPSALRKKKREKLMTITEAERAAKDAGFAVVDVRKIQKVSKLGRFCEEIGVINLNRGKVAMAQSHMEQLLQQCRSMRDKLSTTFDAEQFVAVVQAEQKILSTYVESASAAFKSVQKMQAIDKAEPPAHRSWIPGQVVAAVQLNVSNSPQENVVASESDRE